jgi:DNA processing protein
LEDLDELLYMTISEQDIRLREEAEAVFNCRSKALSGSALRRAPGGSDELIAEIVRWREKGIHILLARDLNYPSLLRECYDPPQILFYRGETTSALATGPHVSIVGSRKANPNSCEIASNFAKEIADAGGTIVSGLALGIDAAAHNGALKSAHTLPTVAVLGSGLSNIYPSANEKLAFQILERGGLLISQFEPNENPYPSNFLDRNRIIAGMSLGTLVVQAADRSGSLVTAKYALDENREVMAVPGSITDPRFVGSNRLLKQGAALVTAVEDVMDIIPSLIRTKAEKESSASGTTAPQAKILFALKDHEEIHFDELLPLFSDRSTLQRELLELELSGQIAMRPGIVRKCRALTGNL